MKAAAYARFSTDKQQGTSITAQLKGIASFCESNNIEIVDTFIDEAKTGTNTNREGFSRLVQAAKARERKFDAVVIYDITRGSRDVGDWFTFRKEMRLLDMGVLSATEKLGDITNPGDFLTELITVGIGQHTVLQTRQKSIEGTQVRAEQGKFCGGTPPLGYDILNGTYIINEREAEAVRLIFNLYAAGKSYSYIVDQVAALGVLGKRGRPIGTNSLHEILKNERYIGIYTWNKRTVKFMGKWAGGKDNPNMVQIEDVIPRIIDDETWRKVRARMNANKHNTLNKSRRNREYILSGLLRCDKCGGTFVGVTTTNKKGYEYKFYCCANKKRLHTCDAKNIAANDIEPLVVNLIKNEILNGEIIEKTADAILVASAAHSDEASADSLKKEIAGLNTKISNLLRSLEDGLDSSIVRERLIENEARKKILEQKLKEIIPRPPVSREFLIKELRADVERVQDDPANMKELLNKYIVNIKIADNQIEIYAVSDLNSVGCGGRI